MRLSRAKMATGNVKLYQVRLARDNSRKYHAMRFKQKVDISQLTAPVMARRERESEEEDAPSHGEGSEYGRKRREASRRRRQGYGTKDADPDDQPWELREGKKNGKLFTGRKEGGVNLSSAYYMMRQCADGAFEAIPISSWYNFTPGIQYNTFNAEEAEEKYLLKHKTLNYFSLMLSKKMQNNQEGEGEGEGSSASHRLRVTDNDGGRGNSSDEEGPLAREDSEEGGTAKARQHRQKGKKPHKSRVGSGDGSSDETTDDGEMESREVDYISEDSSESEREEKEEERQMEDAQQRGKTEESDRSEEEEEGEEELTEAGKEINALIKKQRSVDAPNSDEGEGEGEDGDAMDQGSTPQSAQGTKRPLEGSDDVAQAPGQPLSKRVHVEENLSVITDQEVLHYLARKPITTKDLVRKFQRRKTSMDKRQVVESLGKILPRLNVEKKEIKDKIYLSLKPSK